MPDASRKRLHRTTFIYWMLLFYIIAALAWWFISLEKQNKQIATLQYKSINIEKDSLSVSQLGDKISYIDKEAKRNTGKYLGEGIAFLILIFIGASFVYRSVRRQFNLQLQQQNFMMAVTHELKTPISVARLNLETLQKYTLDPEKQKKLIRITLDETARLNFLTNNILIVSQLEGNRNQAPKEDLDLSTLLKDCLKDFKNRYPDRLFNEEIEVDADVKGDPLLLQILTNNLLENAIKYSPKESPVTAVLKKYRSGIELQVKDEGPGIPENEKKKIFSKFYRIGNEATRKNQGTGLGLYLCRKIARDHNGDITVTNNEPKGSKFIVIFKQ
ncbi:MAG: HAMP domain-containing histidine kinase [Chitinophagaceae bacterium]|nr:HAMP domain-containing histidine kinase [Chitinophagaceae bacterium]MBK9569473.1 HAMP domain-containing histidine kinase [Chitinophagaceae bacterium]MBL0132401.1 HAMP domain-containing histidine kinase [Chitinophagaceae bacterium]MBL0271573.1 HAMP domain-containing histidine kinase [Chitinophagaceae bacterium]